MTPRERIDRAKGKLVAIIDEDELAVRMCEANYRIVRPDHLTAKQALQAMDDEVREGWQRSARAALDYIKDMLDEANEAS